MPQPAWPITIVMIEDDEGHAKLIERNIRRAGVQNTIKPFCDGQSALEFLLKDEARRSPRSGRQLIVLLDLNLPDMSGLEILKRLKSTPGTSRIPIMILTTTDDASEIRRCYDLGANIYVTKPVDCDTFSNAIKQLGLFLSIIQIPPTD
jgi:CheY-like chemotaxis protein